MDLKTVYVSNTIPARIRTVFPIIRKDGLFYIHDAPSPDSWHIYCKYIKPSRTFSRIKCDWCQPYIVIYVIFNRS